MDEKKRSLILRAKELLTKGGSTSRPVDPPEDPPSQGPKRATSSTRASILATCSVAKKPFLMIWKPAPTGQTWMACGARGLLPSDSTAASSDGKRIVLRGALSVSADYPGCPYCKNKSFVRCCEKIACQGASEKHQTADLYCPTCDTWSAPAPGGARDLVAGVGDGSPPIRRESIGAPVRPALPPRR